MSWLDDLFGAGDARRDNAASFNDASQSIKDGYNQARKDLRSGTSSQLAALRSGNSNALTALANGYGQGRRDLQSGISTARGDINDGTDAAIGAENTFLDRVSGIYDPYIEDGNAAGELYQDAIGVNGATAQQGFYDDFQEDPFFQYNQDQALEALERRNNAGGVGGGRAVLAGQRVAQEMGSEALNDRLNRLAGLYDMAVQSSDRMAGYTASAGARIGGYEAGRGTQLAGVAQRGGEAKASLSQGYGSSRAGQHNTHASNVASVQGSNSGSLADLAFGKAQLDANNRISLGNANAATRGVGMNNLVKLAGTAIQAFTPGAGGVSAAGNILKGLG